MSLRPVSAKTWIELSREALQHNYELVQTLVKPAAVIPVIKANAYGHGLIEIARGLSSAKAPFFAIDSLDEALTLRANGVKTPILCLGHIPFEAIVQAVHEEISFVVCQKEALFYAQRASTAALPAKVHLELETGLHRQGLSEQDLNAFLETLSQMEFVELEGVCTHYSNIEEVAHPERAFEQLNQFKRMLETIEGQGFQPAWRHTSCSAGGFFFPETHFDAIRLGISLYGEWSCDEIGKRLQGQVDLKPVLTWKTLIAQLKLVEAGAYIGYGSQTRLTQAAKIAVLPVGYADGFDRSSNSSHGEVLIRGQRCPIVGRICMNMFMVDVTHLPVVHVEDEVVLLGRQGNERIFAESWNHSGQNMINYEVLARLNPLIPRVLY